MATGWHTIQKRMARVVYDGFTGINGVHCCRAGFLQPEPIRLFSKIKIDQNQ